MITGQEKICNWIDSLSLDEFPRSLIICGESGGGKTLLCKYIAEKYHLTEIDLTESLDQETIDEIYNRVEPYLYRIRINEISVKEENVILKFLEEPLKNSYIVLTAETDDGILPTILNRCQIQYLQSYSKEFLKTFLTKDNPIILDIAHTPGQVMKLCECEFNRVVELAAKIVDKIAIASITNTLSVANKVTFKDEKDKIDGRILIDVLLFTFTARWKLENNVKFSNAYLLTSELKKNLFIKNLDYKVLFENYLLSLRALMRGAV